MSSIKNDRPRARDAVSIHEAFGFGLHPHPQKTSSDWRTRELNPVDAGPGGAQVQGYPQLHSGLKASWSTVGPVCMYE